MDQERIERLIWEIAAKMAKATNIAEFEKFESMYTALKTQWNKKTSNKLIYMEA